MTKRAINKKDIIKEQKTDIKNFKTETKRLKHFLKSQCKVHNIKQKQ